jgi:hypothetical protein
MAPPLTNISPIASVAGHLNCIRTEDAERLSDNELRVSRLGPEIVWHSQNCRGIIGVPDLLAVDLATVTHGPSRFLAIVVTFRDVNGPASHRMILGPESEVDWFEDAIGRLRDTIWPSQNPQNLD